MADDYAGDTSTTGTVTIGGSASGVIEASGDVDYFAVTLTAGKTYEFSLTPSSNSKATSASPLTDPYLRLMQASSTTAVFEDDNSGSNGKSGGNALIRYSVPTTGTYYLAAQDATSGSGSYNLSASEISTLAKDASFVVLQNGSPAVVGAGSGDDTYLISGSMIPAGKNLTISDAIGNNSIQLAAGLSITSSQVASNALKLTLSTGSTITILGANAYTYDVGGNTTTGGDQTDVSYSTLVTGTLGASIPASGIDTGSSLVIGAGTAAASLVSTSSGDDYLVLQNSSPAVVGAGAGNDTYLISSHLLPAGANLTISDALGNNSIQLAAGLSIASSQVASNALKLTLSTGATITILGANNFTYDVGGNITAGIDRTDVSYSNLVTGTLGTTIPSSGIATGGTVVIGGTQTQSNHRLASALANDTSTLDADEPNVQDSAPSSDDNSWPMVLLAGIADSVPII